MSGTKYWRVESTGSYLGHRGRYLLSTPHTRTVSREIRQSGSCLFCPLMIRIKAIQKVFPVLFAVACAIYLFWANIKKPVGIPKSVSTRHPLGLGWRDTLVVAAQTSECGEWGGHREVIKVYLDSELAQQKGLGYEATDSVPRIAAWFRDTLCPASLPGHHLFLAGQHELGLPQEKAIFRYMQQLLPYGLQTPYPSHAGNVYSVTCNSGLGNRAAISLYDTRNEWHEFGPLRQLLFPK